MKTLFEFTGNRNAYIGYKSEDDNIISVVRYSLKTGERNGEETFLQQEKAIEWVSGEIKTESMEPIPCFCNGLDAFCNICHGEGSYIEKEETMAV